MAWIGPTISAGAALLGSSGGGESTRYKLPKFLLKPGTAQRHRDSTEDLYTNPENWAQYPGAPPIGPINAWESAALEGYGGLGNIASDLGDLYTTGVTSGMMTNPNMPYAGGFANAPAMWNAWAGAGPQELTVGPISGGGVDPYQGMYGSTAGITADPNAAINEMLSGQVDDRFTGALDAAFQAQNRNFTERLLPQLGVLDDQFTGGQGGAGGLKVAQRALEDLNQQQSEMSTQAGYNAYLDALNRRDTGANLATSARLSQSGQDLTGASLGQQLGRFESDLGFRYGATNQDAAIAQGIANQGAYFNYGDMVGRGAQIGAGAAYNAGALDNQYLSQIPNIYNTYAGAPGAWASAGSAYRGITDPLFANEFAREQYTNQLPFMMNQQYGDSLSQMAGMGRPSTSTSQPNPWATAALAAADAWANRPPAAVPPPVMTGAGNPIIPAYGNNSLGSGNDYYNWGLPGG